MDSASLGGLVGLSGGRHDQPHDIDPSNLTKGRHRGARDGLDLTGVMGKTNQRTEANLDVSQLVDKDRHHRAHNAVGEHSDLAGKLIDDGEVAVHDLGHI